MSKATGPIVPLGLIASPDDEPNVFDAASQLQNQKLLVTAVDAAGNYAAPPLPFSASEAETKMYLATAVQDSAALRAARNWVWVGIGIIVALDFLFTFVPALLFVILRFRASLGPTLVGVLFLVRLSVYLYIVGNMHIVHLAAATQSIVKNGTKSIVPRFMHSIGALGSHKMFWFEQKTMGLSISVALISFHLAFMNEKYHSDTSFFLAIVYGTVALVWPLIQHIVVQEVILERSLQSYTASYIKKKRHEYEHPFETKTVEVRKNN